MKQNLLHGLVAGLLTAAAALIYNEVYSSTVQVDFSDVISPVTIIPVCIIGCLMASTGYHFFSGGLRTGADLWFNLIFVVMSFASFIGPFAGSDSTAGSAPGQFLGLTVPMHLFPVTFWLAMKPLFKGKQEEQARE